MAPPGAGNTKPCDYPKHTGSDWVSEPALFPTRLIWTLWDVCLCSAFLPSLQFTFFPPRPEKIHSRTCHLGMTSLSFTSFTQKQKKKDPNLLTRSGFFRHCLTNKALGKNLVVFKSKLDFLCRLRAQKRETSLLLC